jgi:hypothetical protein
MTLRTLPSKDEVAGPTLEALLRELLGEVKGLRLDLRKPVTDRGRVSLSRADRELLGRLLPAIGGVFGSEPFLARDLFEHDSAAAALRLVSAALKPRQLGRLFQRAVDIPISGYMVVRAGDELHTRLWRVLEVPGSPLPAVPPRVSASLP